MAGLAHLMRLNDHWFRLDETLFSTFVEQWRPKTQQTFHMSFEECTITLQGVIGCVASGGLHQQLHREVHLDAGDIQSPFHDIDKETVRRCARV
ncbi:hypothetical protein Ahy_A03g011319 [Arachis hypogaea]|uniref:Aminotransferase-like plant mobile domain-containing protein n=1 Tax=Arachis hypogaea TaxID=3818 RepID=A0A445DQC6_ARAHY|nr:hypothetical protein Ahy_A03g011319 [Arachis hypogaea]